MINVRFAMKPVRLAMVTQTKIVMNAVTVGIKIKMVAACNVILVVLLVMDHIREIA